MHEFVCLHACVREGVRPSVCLSACMFVRPKDCSHMRAFINACAAFLISNFLLLTSNFHVCTRVFASVRICAYVYPSVRMYLSASFVRVSMLAFVFVHARVRAWERMCESIRPPVRPSVCLSVCPSACMFVRPNVWSYMRAFINVCVRVFACTRAWGRMFGSVRPSVCLSVRVHGRASKCLFAHAKKIRKDDRVKTTVQQLKTG